jgi:hypothetical protein
MQRNRPTSRLGGPKGRKTKKRWSRMNGKGRMIDRCTNKAGQSSSQASVQTGRTRRHGRRGSTCQGSASTRRNIRSRWAARETADRSPIVTTAIVLGSVNRDQRPERRLYRDETNGRRISPMPDREPQRGHNNRETPRQDDRSR